MSSEAMVLTAIGIVLTGIVTFVAGLAAARLQQQRKLLGYAVLTAELIIPELPGDSGLQLMARRSLLEAGSNETDDDLVAVQRLFGFRVRLHNGGNTPLEEQRVSITLEGSAKIIALSVEESPDLGASTIDTQIDVNSPHTCYAVLPFLNSGDDVILSLQSVGNGNRTCRVSAGGVGLKVRDLERYSVRVALLAVALIVLGVVVFVAAAAIGNATYESETQSVTREAAGDGLRGWSQLGLAILGIGILTTAAALFAVATRINPGRPARVR